MKLLPFSESHETDKLFSHKRNECGVIHNTFVQNLQCLLKFFLRIFYETFSQEYWYFRGHFVLLFVCLIDFSLYWCSIIFLCVPHTVPNIGHSEKDWARLFLFQKILSFFELLDEDKKVNRNRNCTVRSISSLISLFRSQLINLFLCINMKFTRSMFLAWFW